jgi:hypothetical protein
MQAKNQLSFVLKQLFVAFPNTQVPDGTVAVYLRLLQDIPVGDLQTVVDQAIATSRFLPTVAELRDMYRSLTTNVNQMDGEEAWGLVQAEIRRIGSWGTPRFEDERVAKAVQAMGWMNLCQSDAPGVERAQFMRIYNSMAQRAERIDKLLPQAKAMATHRGLLPVGNTVKALTTKEG